MLQLKWFRIETGKDGSITSCEEVEAKGRNGGVVRFYEATTKAEACSAAKAWYARTCENNRARSKRYADARKAQGLCATCGVRERINASYCQECTVRFNARHAERRRLKRAGVDVSRPVKTQDQILADHARHREGQRSAYEKARITKPETLVSVNAVAALKKFDELGPVEFRKWLVAKIEAAKPAPPPAPGEKLVRGKKKIDWFEDTLAASAPAEAQ